MIRAILLHLTSHTDPGTVKSVLYLGQGALILAALLLFFYVRNREPQSGFKLREADRKKAQPPQAPGARPSLARAVKPAQPKEDPLANARLETKPKPLRLAGISLTGAAHEILGVAPNASADEIQKAYRDLMKQYHPDRVGRPGTREWNDAQKIAETINRAKSELLARKQGR